MTTEEFRELALSFPGVEERPHFERAAFKIMNKRIFATLLESDKTANLVLSIDDQATFTSYEGGVIYPVANKWGLKGWTTFELDKISKELVLDALECAYRNGLKSEKGNK